MFYREYDEPTLKRLQQTEMDMLHDFVDLCERHHIDYFAGGGTGIGALRHGGFIPWDDDIDLCFARKDYDRFLEIAQKEFAGKYTILNTEENPNYPLMTTRLVKNGTSFREECFKDVDCDLGIFLDLYCFDNIADDDKAMKHQVLWAWFWGKLLVLRSVARPTLYMHGAKAKLVTACCVFGHACMKLFHISKKFLYRKAKKHAIAYQNTSTRRMAWCFDPDPYACILNRDDIYPTRKILFGDVELRFPNHLEEYLTRKYGDYMQMPPEDKRHNHPPYDLDFGEEPQ